VTRNATKLANASKNLGRNACEKPRNDIAEVATVIMVNVIIETTTKNAMLITPDLHTGNPATTTANHTANLAVTMGNLMANPATTTENPKLEKIISPMGIPRSFPR